jgi:hypothetical protein
VKEAGYLIIGGTPQYNNYDDWCLWYDREMWFDFIVPNKIKTFPCAGGGGYPSNTMNPRQFAEHCLSSQHTRDILATRAKCSPFFTVRDEHAATLLRKMDKPPEYRLFGCTATFASMARGVEWEPEDYLAIVPPGPASIPDSYLPKDSKHPHRDMVQRFVDCGRALADEHGQKPLFIAHYFPEYIFFKELGIPADEIFFSNDYNALLKTYSRCAMVLSGRLHGALPAFGMCGPRVVHVGIDTRMSAVDYFDNWIPNMRIQDMNEDKVLQAMEFATSWSNSERHYEYWELQIQFYRNRMREEGVLT